MTGIRRPYHCKSARALRLLWEKLRLGGVNPERKSVVEPLRQPGEQRKPCPQLLQQCLYRLYRFTLALQAKPRWGPQILGDLRSPYTPTLTLAQR